jgi:hypothetical protein
MKKSAIRAAISAGLLLAVLVPSAAMADTPLLFVGTFDTYGACQAAIADANKATRKDGAFGRSPSEQNAFTRENYYCALYNGKYVVFRVS